MFEASTQKHQRFGLHKAAIGLVSGFFTNVALIFRFTQRMERLLLASQKHLGFGWILTQGVIFSRYVQY
ncbi:hypothetical protein [Paracoccus halophilus]|uniref:hypothetical protein n=1 Tax=Paracoccus halophilus TaxID=376733 RepID=UPI00056B0A3E|nr:hypothetical protein [Paracoccus halophilus]